VIIYKVTNLINNKIYIGQTSNTLEVRKGQHLREAESEAVNKRRNIYFHNALLKYGEENFNWEVIDEAYNQEELDEKERYWINFYQSTDKSKGYNLDSGGKTGGVKSEETKKKIGETTKDKWADPETAKKMKDGLIKATKTWQEVCQNNQVEWTCPICKKTKKYAPWELKNRQTCSPKCAGKLPSKTKPNTITAQKNHQNNINKKGPIKEKILEWATNNKDLVLNCPYNKITLVTIPLLEYLEVHDIRSLFICFNVSSRKEFLKAIQDYLINENIC